MLLGIAPRHQKTFSGEPKPKQQTRIVWAPISSAEIVVQTEDHLVKFRTRVGRPVGRGKNLQLWPWGHRGGGTATGLCAWESVKGQAKVTDAELKNNGCVEGHKGEIVFCTLQVERKTWIIGQSLRKSVFSWKLFDSSFNKDLFRFWNSLSR